VYFLVYVKTPTSILKFLNGKMV